MPDAITSMKAGETRPIYGTVTAASGTMEITAATCTLYDGTGAVASGHSADEAVTGFETGEQAEAQVWVVINAASPALDEGIYTLVFTVEAEGSDEIDRVYQPSVLVRVLPATS